MLDTAQKEAIGRFFTVTAFAVLSIAGIGFALYLFIFATNIYTYVLAVSFTLLSLIAGFFNVSAAIWYYRSHRYNEYLRGIIKKLKPLSRFPTVTIAVPVYNEDPEMVRGAMDALVRINYPKDRLHLFMCDDSSDKGIAEEIRKIAESHGMAYLHRDKNTAFKAGNMNNMLKHTNDEFVAIFDADEVLEDRNFLMDVLPFFQDPKLSYIQTEKRDQQESFFSNSVDIFNAFFFKFIQPARSLNNTALFAGSCGVLRKSVLDEVGGFPEYVTEDTFFSFESDLHGYKGLYLPRIYARGKPIRSFTELAKQQWRYNYGDTQFIGYFMKKKGFMRKSPLPNMDYIAHGFGLNYLSIVLILFTLLSIWVVFANLPFAHINLGTVFANTQLPVWMELLGFFAFIMSLLAPVVLTKLYFNSWSKGLMVFLLNYALAFVRTRAAIATLLNEDPGNHWNRLKLLQVKKGLAYTLSSTKAELMFSLGLFALAYVALTHYNVTGAVWLGWYGFLYMLATVFVYKYG